MQHMQTYTQHAHTMYLCVCVGLCLCGEGLSQGPYVATRAGFEPATLDRLHKLYIYDAMSRPSISHERRIKRSPWQRDALLIDDVIGPNNKVETSKASVHHLNVTQQVLHWVVDIRRFKLMGTSTGPPLIRRNDGLCILIHFSLNLMLSIAA